MAGFRHCDGRREASAHACLTPHGRCTCRPFWKRLRLDIHLLELSFGRLHEAAETTGFRRSFFHSQRVDNCANFLDQVGLAFFGNSGGLLTFLFLILCLLLLGRRDECEVVRLDCFLFELVCAAKHGLDMLHGSLDVLYLLHLLLLEDLTKAVYYLQTLLLVVLLDEQFERGGLYQHLEASAGEFGLHETLRA